MKLKGNFVLRQIMGETIVIPVGDAMLNLNGMICLNEVGELIFRGLQAEDSREKILDEILENFDVTYEEAAGDLDDFLRRFCEVGLLEK